MNATGVFFTLRDRPGRSLKKGEGVRLGIVMEHGDPRGGPVVVRCAGTIVRVEPMPGIVGVAVVLEAYEFDMPWTSSSTTSEPDATQRRRSARTLHGAG